MKFVTAYVIGVVATMALTLTAPCLSADNAHAQKAMIHSQSELPTYSYKINAPSINALLDNDTELHTLADAVRKDTEATLAKYEISDNATLSDLYGVIRDAALLIGDGKVALAYSSKVRELSDKPAAKLTAGLPEDAAIAAMAAGDDPSKRKAAFKEAFAASIASLPWAVVGDDLTSMQGEYETPNMGTFLRRATADKFDPGLKNPVASVGIRREESSMSLCVSGALSLTSRKPPPC